MIGPNRSDSFGGPVGEARAASTAGGGTALTSTAALVPIPNGTDRIGIIARNFATAVVVKFALNPYLLILRSDDGLASVTDYSSQGQQSGGTGVSLATLAARPTGVVYVGAQVPFRGVAVTMSASVNAVASVLTVEYWNGTAWVSTAATDGTANGGATFAQTGNVTWTVPSAWAKAFPLATTTPPQPVSTQQKMLYSDKSRYWTRWSVGAALTAATSAALMLAMNRSTVYAEAVQDSLYQQRIVKGVDGTGCVELLTDAGTANAIVNCYTNPQGAF